MAYSCNRGEESLSHRICSSFTVPYPIPDIPFTRKFVQGSGGDTANFSSRVDLAPMYMKTFVLFLYVKTNRLYNDTMSFRSML